MERYETHFGLPQVLVGRVDDEQIAELFESGWRFDPDRQLWVKVFYAATGAPETPAFLVRIIEDLVARNILEELAYPGLDTSPEHTAVVGPAEGPWGEVLSILAESFREPADLNLGERAQGLQLQDVVDAAVLLGCALAFDWNDDHEVQARCRAICDRRVGWRTEEMTRRDALAFVWDDNGQRGRVDSGLLAFDRYLQSRPTGKRLVAVDTGADWHASFLITDGNAGQLIAAFERCGETAGLQDGTAPVGPSTKPAATRPVDKPQDSKPRFGFYLRD